jgi:hypothetical protein
MHLGFPRKSYQHRNAFILSVWAAIAEPGRGKNMRVVDPVETTPYIWFTLSSFDLEELFGIVHCRPAERGRKSVFLLRRMNKGRRDVIAPVSDSRPGV